MPPKTPSYPPVRGRLDTETSLEEERNARMKEMKKETQERKKVMKKETQERKKGRNARKNERKERKNEWMNEWKEETQAESVIYLPPRGIRGGLVSGLPLTGGREGVFGSSFFLFIYIYFSLYIKKKINKNNNKWCGKSGKGGISYWCSIRIVIYTLWINGGDMCGKGNDKCGFLHMMENG